MNKEEKETGKQEEESKIEQELKEKDVKEKVDEKPEKKPKKKLEELEKIQMAKLRGRVVILNPEQSEFAKNLNLNKKANYVKKK